MALAQALRSMPVGALLVRFPKQLDATLGKPPRDPVKRPKIFAATRKKSFDDQLVYTEPNQ